MHSQRPPVSVQTSVRFGQKPPHVGAVALTHSGRGIPVHSQEPALSVQT
jgi:hypothetical protein